MVAGQLYLSTNVMFSVIMQFEPASSIGVRSSEETNLRSPKCALDRNSTSKAVTRPSLLASISSNCASVGDILDCSVAYIAVYITSLRSNIPSPLMSLLCGIRQCDGTVKLTASIMLSALSEKATLPACDLLGVGSPIVSAFKPISVNVMILGSK